MAKDCSSRGSFNDIYDANKECNRLKDKYNSNYNSYLCPICGKYHVREEFFSSESKASSCTGRFGEKKKRYSTRSEALDAMYESMSSAVDVYYCNKCKGYHLTSHPRDKKGLRK